MILSTRASASSGQGPYSSETSVSLMIARQLCTESVLLGILSVFAGVILHSVRTMFIHFR